MISDIVCGIRKVKVECPSVVRIRAEPEQHHKLAPAGLERPLISHSKIQVAASPHPSEWVNIFYSPTSKLPEVDFRTEFFTLAVIHLKKKEVIFLCTKIKFVSALRCVAFVQIFFMCRGTHIWSQFLAFGRRSIDALPYGWLTVQFL